MDFGRATPTDVAQYRVTVPLETLARVSLDGIAYIDDSDRIVIWNDAATAVTGIERERACGFQIDAVFSNAGDVLTGVQRHTGDVRLLPTSDPLHTIHATCAPVDRGYLLSFGLQRRFNAIEHLKNEIVAAVSHELKTPIATIKAYATTLRQRGDAAASERDDYLATIEEQADVLTRAVNDLLLASQADAHHLPVRRVTVALSSILDAALLEITGPTNGRTIGRSEDRVEIFGDPDLLREVFAQLLDNALKFSTATGTVSIEASADASWTTVRILDRGIGIAQEHLPYIFERFYRVEANLTAANAGTGLGLYIADAIVRAHGGNIAVESEVGHGSIFTVALPCR